MEKFIANRIVSSRIPSTAGKAEVIVANEKHALKSVAQSSRKRWDCNRFQTMENTLTRFQFAKSLPRPAKKYFSQIFYFLSPPSF